MAPKSQNECSLTTIAGASSAARREDALYDLPSDPYELKDVKAENPKIHAAFKQQLDAMVKEQRLRRRYYARGIVNTKLTAAEEPSRPTP